MVQSNDFKKLADKVGNIDFQIESLKTLVVILEYVKKNATQGYIQLGISYEELEKKPSQGTVRKLEKLGFSVALGEKEIVIDWSFV